MPTPAPATAARRTMRPDRGRRAAVVGLALGLLGLSGCSFFPQWLRPENLWKFNAQDPGAGEEDMYFSVPAPPLSATSTTDDDAR
jgi:hypothetical protein